MDLRRLRYFLAVADELRSIKELLELVTGRIGGGATEGRGFIQVFDEAP